MSTIENTVKRQTGKMKDAAIAAYRHYIAPKYRIIFADRNPLAMPPMLSIKKLCTAKITFKYGLIRPATITVKIIQTITKIYAPIPLKTDSNAGYYGGLKTSP